MRRIPAALVALTVATATATASTTAVVPAIAQETGGNTLGEASSKLDSTSSNADAKSSQAAGTDDPSSTLPFNPFIVVGALVGFVVVMNLLLNAINADQYRTIFSGSSK